MNAQAVLQDLRSLPSDKQEEVADFIAFLKSRRTVPYGPPASAANTSRSTGFFGMWSDRSDMGNGASWVRESRSAEWEGDRG